MQYQTTQRYFDEIATRKTEFAENSTDADKKNTLMIRIDHAKKLENHQDFG